MNYPIYSIIIATYNRVNLLSRAFDSLLAQTEKSWEALIIDDGSTDDTEQLVKSYQSQYPNFKYFKQENQGVVAAKNRGIALSTGVYITFLDSDDAYKPNHLASRLCLLQLHPEVDTLHGGVNIIGDQYVVDANNLERKIHLSECTIGATIFMKKQSWQKLGGFRNPPINTDADLMKRIITAKMMVLKTEIPTYIYYRDEHCSITQFYS